MMEPSPMAAPSTDPQQEQHHEPYPQHVSSNDEIRTLWIEGLQGWMDEDYLRECFASSQALLSVKFIRYKHTGLSEGYGFLEFASNAAAQMVLQNYNGLQMPRAEQFYRLNWARYNNGENPPRDFTIFVGDLASDDTDELLRETFRAKYPSVKGAKVITDRVTGRSKGYGFVTFGDGNEQARAIIEMNGLFCSSRPMRIGPAITKQATVYQQPYPPQVVELEAENDPNYNTTLFVGGLDPNVTLEMLMETFGLDPTVTYLNWATNNGRENRSEDFTIFVGDLASGDTDELLRETFSAKYPSVKEATVITDRVTGRSKGFGFVTFGDGNEQARAITEMNGMFCSSRPMWISPAISR